MHKNILIWKDHLLDAKKITCHLDKKEQTHEDLLFYVIM